MVTLRIYLAQNEAIFDEVTFQVSAPEAYYAITEPNAMSSWRGGAMVRALVVLFVRCGSFRFVGAAWCCRLSGGVSGRRAMDRQSYSRRYNVRCYGA